MNHRNQHKDTCFISENKEHRTDYYPLAELIDCIHKWYASIQEACSLSLVVNCLLFKELFKNHGSKTMLCGHLHRNLFSQADGIQVFVASATGNPFDGQDGMPMVKVGKDAFDYRFVTLKEHEMPMTK